MSPVNPIFALLLFALAFGTASILARFGVLRPVTNRVSPIDGLRGYLALGVFCHHSMIWFYYLQSGRWTAPPSHLYTLLGESSVGLFFIISAFLFTSKLLESDRRPLDWTRLYASRLLRLAPLYLAAMLVLFIFVAMRSDFIRHQPLLTLFREAAAWIAFSIPGQPALNLQADTSLMMAGVTWSLPYEWLLYVSLPVLALAFRRAVPLWWVAGAILTVLLLRRMTYFDPSRLLLFVGGIVAAFAVRLPRLRALACTKTATGIAILCLAIGFLGYSTAYQANVIILLTIGFTIIACGNSCLGVLLHPASRLLGEISYSLYLLQGFVLYAAFTWMTPAIGMANDNPALHWAVVLTATPLFIVLCVMSFSRIEAPAMRHTGALTAWLKSLSLKRKATVIGHQ